LVGRGKVLAFQRVQEIAQRHEATFHNPHLIDEGYKYWFECQNLGQPFNGATASAIQQELLKANITLPGR
jgi:hypothetical protein